MVTATWPTPTTQEVVHEQMEVTETGRRKSKTAETSHSIGLADHVKATTNYCPTSGQTPSGSLALTEKFVERLTTLSCWLMGYTLEYISKWDKAKERHGRTRVAKKSQPQGKD
jgi:hypothetical protein